MESIIKNNKDSFNFNSYLVEIGKYPLLSYEEEISLAKKVLDGNEEAKQKLVNHNLRLVVKIAKCYKTQHFTIEDLVQEGNLGLLKAAERYDYTKGYKFSTYATWWIKEAILSAIYNREKMIRFPADKINCFLKCKEKVNELTTKLGRTPTYNEIKKCLKLDDKNMLYFINFNNTMLSLDTSYYHDAESDDYNKLLQNQIIDEEYSLEDNVIIDMLKDYFEEIFNKSLKTNEKHRGRLTEKEIIVIKFRYGFYNNKIFTLNEVSKHLGISVGRVRVIEKNALRKLKISKDVNQLYLEYCKKI